jgi:hypothetical protein
MGNQKKSEEKGGKAMIGLKALSGKHKNHEWHGGQGASGLHSLCQSTILVRAGNLSSLHSKLH